MTQGQDRSGTHGGKILGAFLTTLRGLGPMRLAVMAFLVFGLVGFFIFLTTKLTTPQMALLYGDLESEDVGRITQQLDGQGVPYELRKNGTEVHVPSDQVPRVRISMAQQGLPRGGSIGYEIFDKAEALGTTNFIQNINLVRAMEGELSRTIKSIDSIRNARVHLVLPKREMFSREKQPPSASIILTMRTAGRLPREQVLAIQHLVAAAVPGLEPSRISIVDNKGSLLAKGFEEGSPDGALGGKADERRRAYETEIGRNLEELLEKSVGFGNVRTEVSVDMDFDKITTNEETYNPDGQVVRSTQTVEESSSSKEADATSPIGVQTNLPDANSTNGSGSNANNENRTEETVNYEISKKVTSHIREAGVVKRLSVAVLVDGSYVTDPKGDRQYKERSEQEMNNIAALVRTAVGFNAERGDKIEVINMKFAEGEEPLEEPLQLFFGFTKNDILRIAEFLVLGIVAVLVILLVVRPLLSRAFEALPGAVGAAAGAGRLLADQAAEQARAALPGPEEVPAEDEEIEELIDIDRIEGRVRASSVKKVGEIVDKHPDEALSIIRTWMYQES
jgi:flagellar M-ring protein FliF